jgi:hydrogenase maturation protease
LQEVLQPSTFIQQYLDGMKTLIIGLGNPILGDDGVGWKVAKEIEQRLDKRSTADLRSSVEVDLLSLGGLNLMERLTGYKRVILIDAIFTGKQPIGTVTTFPLTALPNPTAGHSASAHDTSLRTALNVGRSMNISLPDDDQIIIVAVEAHSEYDFSEELSPPVAAAVPQAVRSVFDLLA